MKIIIVGAGEIGKHLAYVLSHDKHDVVVIDKVGDLLDHIKEHLDVMTVEGSGSNIDCLIRAGAKNSDIVIAVSGSESTNVISCQIAAHLGVKNTICRLDSKDFFSEKEKFLPETLHIKNVIVPQYEAVRKILNVLDNKIVSERILFTNPNAIMTAFEVVPSSPLAGSRIKDLSNMEILGHIRFAAILRDRKHIIPNGDTIIVPGDRIYAAGNKEKVQDVVEWNSTDNCRIRKVLIAGATRIGASLAKELYKMKYEVRVIEKDPKRAADFLDEIKAGVMVINGDATDKDTLAESGADSTDAFISVMDDDEDNILCGIMAKEIGARKVVVTTSKAEYAGIIPAISIIDCGFSKSIIAINTVLRVLNLTSESMRVDAILSRVNAFILEFTVHPESTVCGKRIADIKFPLSAVLAMVFRKGEVLSASGGLILQEGDVVVTITERDKISRIEPLFCKRSIFGL